ncbi:MAG: M12 family metallo-peptidase [Planctomycetaceae bacterium]|nr:M12 family metallo-peptidase [Planctomycetaceae bacterium]
MLTTVLAPILALALHSAPPDAADRGGTTFDASQLEELRVGDPLPESFDAAGGRGLRLVRRTTIADAVHLSFEHPLHQAREASLLVRGGRLTGMIASGDGRCVELRSPRAGVATLTRSDLSTGLPCAGVLTPPAGPDEGGIAGVPCDGGSRIDLFVGYTDASVAQAGGSTQLMDSILWAVADSNTIYTASEIPITLRLVGTRLAEGYIEDASSMANDLYALRDPSDGPLDAVHAAGVAAGADLIALVRANGGGACGIAYLVGDSPTDVGYGVSVTALGCFSNRTFTHELGHNMGCCHAPGDGGGCTSGGVFPYSTGHRFVGTNGTEYRTVMAYAPGTRIGRLSSPLLTFQGTPTGIADERDNARSMRETRFNVANFRCEVCLGDLDDDGTVDAADLGAMLSAWGQSGGDLDADGTTNASDLAALLGNWGPCD